MMSRSRSQGTEVTIVTGAFLGPDSTICANVNVTPQNELPSTDFMFGFRWGRGSIGVVVSQQWTEALNAPSVYVYERNNVKLTDLPMNKHRNVTVKEAKLNRTLHCNSSP